MESVTVQLSSPIRDFGKDINQIAISREVNGGDLLAIDGLGKMASALKLIQLLCVTPEHCGKDGKPNGLSWEGVKALSGRDIAAISDALGPFVGEDQQDET